MNPGSSPHGRTKIRGTVNRPESLRRCWTTNRVRTNDAESYPLAGPTSRERYEDTLLAYAMSGSQVQEINHA
jgi:hypothetical protein